MTDELPDILLVVFDTARRDRFGCYGGKATTTPTVDSLARDGVRFQTMVSNAPWTLPAHASLFTGLYPSQHGSQWQTGPRLRDSVQVTLAEWLGSLGYATVCATNNGLISHRTRLARGFDRYAFRLDLEHGRRRLARRMRKALLGGDSGGRIVNEWLRGILPEMPRPLFLFVNYIEPHWAYVPPARLQRQVGGPRFGPIEGLRYRLRMADRVGPWEAIARADERTLEIYSGLYEAEHLNADGHLDELLGILTRSGRLQEGNTLLIVTSDHGEHIGEHGLADHHASVDDHLTRVPFVVWGPGIVQGGSREGVCEFVDVLPSLARLLDAPTPAPYLDERRTDIFGAEHDPDGDTYAFAEWRAWSEREQARLARRNPSYDFSGLARDLVCVRDRRFKLLRSSDGAEALYDLERHPSEDVDVSASEPDVARRLSRRLDSELSAWQAWEDEEGTELSPEDRREIERHLSALGYM